MFTPLSLSPALWLDASDSMTLFSGASPAAPDGAISEWRDKSGNARHATQSTGVSQPLRKTAIQNGRDVVRFDGSNDAMVSHDWYSSDITVFAVAKTNNASVIQHVLGKFDGGTDEREWLLSFDASNKLRFIKNSTGLAADNQTITTVSSAGTAFGVFDWRKNGTAARMGINAASEDFAFGDAGVFDGTSAWLVGATPGSVTGFLDGDICEIVMFSSALADADVTLMRNYLKTKWGTP